MFNTVFTKPSAWTVSWASSIQFEHSKPPDNKMYNHSVTLYTPKSKGLKSTMYLSRPGTKQSRVWPPTRHLKTELEPTSETSWFKNTYTTVKIEYNHHEHCIRASETLKLRPLLADRPTLRCHILYVIIPSPCVLHASRISTIYI